MYASNARCSFPCSSTLPFALNVHCEIYLVALLNAAHMMLLKFSAIFYLFTFFLRLEGGEKFQVDITKTWLRK